MEFESYDDAYNYYHCYAREVGFRVRVKTSWFKRNSREKYGAVLCCSSQGFKRIKDMRMGMVDSKRWRILEVTLEHNHSLGTKAYKSIKKTGAGDQKKLDSNSNTEVQTIKLYRALVIAAGANRNSNCSARRCQTPSNFHDMLNIRKGDIQAMYNYFCRMQLTKPNFFYLMDLNDEVQAAYAYFVDVIYIDNSYLSNIDPSCGICGHKSPWSINIKASYVWVFKAWFTCSLGRFPQTIITERRKVLETAISEVFPRSLHCFALSHIMREVPEKLGGLRNYDVIRKALIKTLYSLYSDRAKWAPVYLKDTSFAGMATSGSNETLTAFDKYMHKQNPVKEFLDKYELALQKKFKEEVLADMESRNSNPELKTRCSFELLLSKLYTSDIFKRFQLEVEDMYPCFSTTQLHVDGQICFNFYGYLCRHALRVLNFNGVEEIPSKYILSRWKKDYKLLCASDPESSSIESTEQVQWYSQLYRSALLVVEEWVTSIDQYKVA
ncbi:unnamed protein product [Withania somnifera]